MFPERPFNETNCQLSRRPVRIQCLTPSANSDYDGGQPSGVTVASHPPVTSPAP